VRKIIEASIVFSITTLASFRLGNLVKPDLKTPLSAGSVYDFEWRADSLYFGSRARFQLYRDTVWVDDLLSAEFGQTYSVYISWKACTGSNYRLKVVDYNQPRLYQFTDTFTINHPDTTNCIPY